MSTIATTIAGPKTYSAEELQALHLAMNAKAKRKKMLQKTALVTMNLIVCLFMLFPLLYTISVAFMPSGELIHNGNEYRSQTSDAGKFCGSIS